MFASVVRMVCVFVVCFVCFCVVFSFEALGWVGMEWGLDGMGLELIGS